MAYVATTAGEFRSGSSVFVAGRIASIAAMLAFAFGAAAWTVGFNPASLVRAPLVQKPLVQTSLFSPATFSPATFSRATFAGTANASASDASTFNDRFSPSAAPPASLLSPRPFIQSLSSEVETKIQQAKNRLAARLQSQDWRADLIDGPSFASASAVDTRGDGKIDGLKPSIGAGVPLPRSRPAEAKLEVASVQSAYASAGPPEAVAARSDDRSLLQKLSDMLPTGGIKLASLEPNFDGLSHDGPDLVALGYDNQTAVYDITARAVYLPNGTKLEAHSGMGSLMDDPEHVNERMVGATPPAVYDLKPRERIFHGVEALRMIPEDSNATLGRSGLLTHSYMLGPKGDSNGCVSIKRYEAFLKAYKKGEISRLVVVPRLNDAVPASQKTASASQS
jgi:hypothetical protein